MDRTKNNIKKMLRKEIASEFKELAVKMKEPDSKIMPYVLEKLMTLEQAKILNSLPNTVEKIAQGLNLSQDAVNKQFREMFEKGLLYPGRSGWHLTRSWAALHDSAPSSHSKYDNDDFLDLAFAKADESVAKQIDEVAKGQAKTIRQGMRVIPRWKSIENVAGVLPYENIKEIFKNAEPIVLLPCACKKIDRNRKCRETIPLESCITIGRSGQYNLDRGTGRKLSYDETIALLEEFDQYQLVHLVGNYNSMPALVCNCHNCCCGSFYRNKFARKKINQFSIAKSRFLATVDTEKCTVCKTCVARCPVDAVKMKRPTGDGLEKSFTVDEECIGCGLCVLTCPSGARKMKLIRPPEYIPNRDASTADP